MKHSLKHAIYVALAFGLTALTLFANRAHAIEQIIRPYETVRSASMGGVRLTTGMYDDNFFGNPARATQDPKWKISLLDLTAETSSSTLTNVGDITSGGGSTLNKIGNTAGNNNHGRIQTAFPAIYLPNMFGDRVTMDFAILTNTQFDIALRRSYQIDPNAYTDIGPAFNIARKFLDDKNLSVGLTTHVTYRIATKSDFSLVDLIQGSSFSPTKTGGDGANVDFDTGATWSPHWHPGGWELTSALAFNNLMGGNYSNLHLHLLKTNALPPPQPRTMGMGVAGRKDLPYFKDFVVAFEVTDIGNNSGGSWGRLIHMGAETRVLRVLLPRVGINQGYWAAGLGIDLRFLQIDLASYGEEMGLNPGDEEDRRYAVRIALQI